MSPRRVPAAVEAELGADRVAELVALAATGRVDEAVHLAGDAAAADWVSAAGDGLWQLADGTIVGRHAEGT